MFGKALGYEINGDDRMRFSRKNFRPAQQGDLDGFCGVYALFHFFCRRLDVNPHDDEAKLIFKRLLELIEDQGKLTSMRVVDGFLEGQLQKAFNKYAKEKQIPVKARRLEIFANRIGAKSIFEVITNFADDEAAMIHMDDCDHWVLAHSGTAKQFYIDDSSEAPETMRIRAAAIVQYDIGLKHGLVFQNAQTH